jgi:hypothetical protein
MRLSISGSDIEKTLVSDAFEVGDDVAGTLRRVVLETYRKRFPQAVGVVRLEEKVWEGRHAGWFDCTLAVESPAKAPNAQPTRVWIRVRVVTIPRPDPDKGY